MLSRIQALLLELRLKNSVDISYLKSIEILADYLSQGLEYKNSISALITNTSLEKRKKSYFLILLYQITNLLPLVNFGPRYPIVSKSNKSYPKLFIICQLD